MPVKELAHTTKTTTEKPRGSIRIQLDTPPNKPRRVRDWPVFDREEWSNFFMWVFLAGVATTFGGLIV